MSVDGHAIVMMAGTGRRGGLNAQPPQALFNPLPTSSQPLANSETQCATVVPITPFFHPWDRAAHEACLCTPETVRLHTTLLHAIAGTTNNMPPYMRSHHGCKQMP
jgi:hypothetical protein